MSTEENKALVRRVLEEAFNKHNLAVVDELVAPDYVYHGPAREIKGPESYKQATTEVLTTFPDHHLMIEDMVTEGDKVVTRATVGGTHTGGNYMGIAPTGKQFNITWIMISRIAGGKIVEDWESLDLLTQLQQLGIIPPMGGGG